MLQNNFDKNSKGVVLVIVLVLFMALSGLTLMTIEVSSRGAVEASRMRSEYEAGFMAEEALYVIYGLLKDDKTPFSDTLREKWAKEWDDDGLKIIITPCNAKINIKSLISSTDKNRTLKIIGRVLDKGLDVNTMVGSLAIWCGINVNPKLAKIDNFYYASQSPPYAPRGSMLKIPEEILLLRGWEGLDSGWVDENLTVWGGGRLNINFASRETLLAYFPELGKGVDRILHWARTRGFTDLSQVLSVIGIQSDSSIYKNMTNELTVKSDFFDARVTASVGGCTVVKRYIIRRQGALEIGEPELIFQNDISVTFAQDQ
ncbi:MULTISPECIES: general secretion pathway protein GspK [unclassified Maridesulfovibrio]|uniref:general secretion pathway protein GspK n=1 Tax=unclassified Maridesulfovibrio TaxID=2794999 RepID=UPI003B3E6F61